MVSGNSAVTGAGIPALGGRLRSAVERAREAQPVPDAYVVHRPAPEGIRIERNDDGSFEVLGRDAARAVAVNDLTNADALDYVRERLTALGVDRALARSGARNGDIVHISAMSFEYENEDQITLADEGRR